MAQPDPIVEPPRAEDRDAWARLYRGYADFYKVSMTEEILTSVWGWLRDPGHEVEALVARDHSRGDLLGLAHFRPFSRVLRGARGMFLDDLYVDPDQRGGGIGRCLIKAVAAEARSRGMPVVRWITADDNYRARMLYDDLATRTMWVTYDLDTEAS